MLNYQSKDKSLFTLRATGAWVLPMIDYKNIIKSYAKGHTWYEKETPTG